jgi:hypothetical protein
MVTTIRRQGRRRSRVRSGLIGKGGTPTPTDLRRYTGRCDTPTRGGVTLLTPLGACADVSRRWSREWTARVVGGWTARVYDDARAQVLLIGGRSGSGKTAVAHEISLRMQELGVAHCHVEGDNLDAAYPKPPDDPHGSRLTEANLAALWRNFRAIGHRRLIYVNTASVLEPQMILRAMSSNPPGAIDVVAVELTARDDTVAARLAVREAGSALAWHVERSRHMAHVLAQQALPTTLRLATDDRDVISIAGEVIGLSGWASPDDLSARE